MTNESVLITQQMLSGIAKSERKYLRKLARILDDARLTVEMDIAMRDCLRTGKHPDEAWAGVAARFPDNLYVDPHAEPEIMRRQIIALTVALFGGSR